jgi:predicted AlkP superfamily phosphohydrolase/phosphomutase
MKTARLASCTLLLLLLISACQHSPTPTASPAPSPTAGDDEALTQRRRAVLVALEGARPDWIAAHIQDGTMPNLARLAERGVQAAYLETVEPALSGPSYLALSTGAFPNATGLVSDRHHTPDRVFAEPSESTTTMAEAIWRTAMRSGLTVAAVLWPSASVDVPDLEANYVVEAADSDVPSAQHLISLGEANGWQAAPPSLSPTQEGVLRILSDEGGTVATFNVLAVDPPEDGPGTYDLLILDNDKDLGNGHIEVELGNWVPVTVSPRLHSGTYICFTASEAGTVTVYQSRVHYNRARPDELAKGLNELGFPPPTPDIEALRHGWLSAQQYYEMAKHRADWTTDVVLQVYRTYQPNLLLTAQSIIADCARAFLLTEADQQDLDPETVSAYADYQQEAHSVADESLGQLLTLVNVADSAVFVLSCGGVAPVHTTVHLNTVLNDAGLLEWNLQQEQYRIDAYESQAAALASQGSAHIYINLLGRDQPGIVTPDEYEDVRQQVIDALAEIQDQEGGAVLARILGSEALPSLHLDSPNSGDVFVQAAPGYCLSDELGFDDVAAPSDYRAGNGFDATLPEMRGIFIAAGDDLARRGEIPSVHITDIAPTIARVFRFAPAVTVSGQAIEDIWR